uniref:Phosphoglycerate mutase-like protein n=1 Tax=Setaria digitata TaxID=48799 RepID=A0A915Q1S2_9BILA
MHLILSGKEMFIVSARLITISFNHVTIAVNSVPKCGKINNESQENVGSPRTTPTKTRRKRLILMRHAERVDRVGFFRFLIVDAELLVFPGWLRLTNLNGTYSRYNLNQPRYLPTRWSGMEGFHNDSPITQIGEFTAQAVAEEITGNYQIGSIYSSPALRCIQTANQFNKFLLPVARIKVEHSLFEWLGWYKIRCYLALNTTLIIDKLMSNTSCNMLQPPKWMSTEELIRSNLNVDMNYKPVHGSNLQPIVGSESIVGYFDRSIDFLKIMLENDKSETICIITHAPTLYIYTRYLLNISDTTPIREELDSSGSKIPYCSSVVMEKNADDDGWKLGKAIKVMTYLNQSTKIDYQFLLNKRNDQFPK